MNYLAFFEPYVEDLKKSGGRRFVGYCPFHGDSDSRKKGFSLDPETGLWKCFSCQKGGNVFTFYKLLGLPIPDDLRLIAGPPSWESTKQRQQKRRSHPSLEKWEPETISPPNEKWQKRAYAIIEKSIIILNCSRDTEAIRNWLRNERGINGKAIKRLGWIPADIYYAKVGWGLEESDHDFWIPSGLLIPTVQDGSVQRIQVRRSIEEDHILLPGSAAKVPMRLDEEKPYLMVLESDLDALLLWEKAEGLPIGFISLRTAQNRPDKKTNVLLRKAKAVFVSLDSDEPGNKEVAWWLENFSNAKPWLIPSTWGKDPGDAVKNGHRDKLAPWLRAALKKVDCDFDNHHAKKEIQTHEDHPVNQIPEHRSNTILAYSKALSQNISLSWDNENPKIVYLDNLKFTEREIQILKDKQQTTAEDLRNVVKIKASFDGEVVG